MLVFTKGDWMMSLAFCAIFAVIVLVPCVIIAIMGRKMIVKIGQSPSQTPAIQLGVFLPLVFLEAFTFACLIGFYNVFSGT